MNFIKYNFDTFGLMNTPTSHVRLSKLVMPNRLSSIMMGQGTLQYVKIQTYTQQKV